MAFKSFEPSSFDDMVDSLPWANQWQKRNKENVSPLFVLGCQVYDESGIMVITSEYKGFVHEGATMHLMLSEALTVWTAERKQFPSLMCICHKKGRLELGIDEEVLNTGWRRTENRYMQLRTDGTPPAVTAKKDNPLLGGSGVQSARGRTNGRTVKDED